MSLASQRGWTTRRVNGLCRELRPLAWAVLGRVYYETGVVLTVPQGTRRGATQARLWAKGRDAEGKVVDPRKVVTWAPPGTSRHEERRKGRGGEAFDVARLHPDGRVTWNDVPWARVGRIGEELGLKWGGRWKGKKRDKPHFQLPRRLRT